MVTLARPIIVGLGAPSPYAIMAAPRPATNVGAVSGAVTPPVAKPPVPSPATRLWGKLWAIPPTVAADGPAPDRLTVSEAIEGAKSLAKLTINLTEADPALAKVVHDYLWSGPAWQAVPDAIRRIPALERKLAVLMTQEAALFGDLCKKDKDLADYYDCYERGGWMDVGVDIVPLCRFIANPNEVPDTVEARAQFERKVKRYRLLLSIINRDDGGTTPGAVLHLETLVHALCKADTFDDIILALRNAPFPIAQNYIAQQVEVFRDRSAKATSVDAFPMIPGLRSAIEEACLTEMTGFRRGDDRRNSSHYLDGSGRHPIATVYVLGDWGRDSRSSG